MISHLGSGTADDRVLFEQAKAKLEEAFALLQSLEGRIQEVPRDPIDAAKRAEERERLLAYVEHAQSEAMRLARRSRRLSRIRLRAQPQANVQRSTDATGESVPAAAVGDDAAARPGEIVTEPVPALPVVEAIIEQVEPSELDAVERAFEAATKELKQRIDAERGELTPERIARSRADTLIGPYGDLDDEAVEISDEELKAFEEAMARTYTPAKIEWRPARAETAESEKAGARMRRDRSPTERMDRPMTDAPYYARFLTVRALVIAVAALVLTTIGVFTVKAMRDSRTADDFVEMPYVFVGPPGELATPAEPEDPVKMTPRPRNARLDRNRGRR
ncbi:MAG: hypothetical protein ACAI38_18545 [Myxococcota bacterium]|nr:hypothetical protein [Myxococcota bacterium]